MGDNRISNILYYLGILTIVFSLIAGISIGNEHYEFLWSIAIIYWAVGFISGMILIGFSEIIRLLHNINFHVNPNKTNGNRITGRSTLQTENHSNEINRINYP